MPSIDVRISGINAPDSDALTTELAKTFSALAGDQMRSDVRVNLSNYPPLHGGEFTSEESQRIVDAVRSTVEAHAGPLNPGTSPRVEFIFVPSTEREEIQKRISDHRFQIGERRDALSRYGSHPAAADMLRAEIKKLEGMITELEDQLSGDA